MFLDASAFCSMLMNEDDAGTFSIKLREARQRITSPIAMWETIISASKGLGTDLEVVRLDVERYVTEFQISVVAIEPDMTRLALDAFRRYGKGRHPAALNFGDCFSYACARYHNVPLLYKGNDFSQTDIEAA